jgi:Tfp pilus assembly protein PilN
VRAVNLIPGDAPRGGRAGGALSLLSPVYALLGLLAVALAYVVVYVLSSNTIADRKAQLASLQQQVAQAQLQAASLSAYAQFEKLAQARADTVRQIAATRFNWQAALSDLSKVVPQNSSLQSLLGTVAPGASVASAGGGSISTGSLRGDVPAPAFELKGCTSTQDDVARLLSRLRLINGVSRVTLADSLKPDSATAASTASTGSTVSAGCGANAPSFDLVVFFAPLPGAGPQGATTVPAAAAAPSGTSLPPAAEPVSNTTGAGK